MACRAGETTNAAPVPATKPPPLLGEVAVFTGGLGIVREEAERAAEMLGCQIRTGVSGKTTIVVVGDADVGRWSGEGSGLTAKHREALARVAAGQRIRVLTEGDFLRLAQVVSDGVITEQEWLDVRELVYAVGFAAPEMAGDGYPRQRKSTRRLAPVENQTAARSEANRQLRSLALLHDADPDSPQDALRVLELFVPSFTADINGFTGTREMDEVEAFIRELAVAPQTVRAFFDRTPGMERFSDGLVQSIAASAHGAVEQIIGSLERVPLEVQDEATKRSLATARDVVNKLRSVAAAPSSRGDAEPEAHKPEPGPGVEVQHPSEDANRSNSMIERSRAIRRGPLLAGVLLVGLALWMLFAVG
jgi:hypothetical protein